MHRSWPFVVAVIAVGVGAGAAIAGRPVASDAFVLGAPATTAEPSSPTSTVPAVSSTPAPITVVATTAVATTAATATTVVPTTSIASTTIPPTVPSTTTVEPATTTTVGPLPRNQFRLVLANGDGRFRLASTTADRIRPLGYTIKLGDALNIVDATVIYYRPGFDDEAAFAAVDIGVPDALILPFPAHTSQPITTADDGGDVIIVLGPDAPR